MDNFNKLFAEALGTMFLVVAIVGAGLAAGTYGASPAITLLAISVAAGAILFVMIATLDSVSAHFNPAVSFAFLLRGEIGTGAMIAKIIAQIIGGIIGVIAANVMFGDVNFIEMSGRDRSGAGPLLGELIATFGLVMVIICTMKWKPVAMAPAVGFFILAAHWFTSSTSFANPAVTIARMFSDNHFTGVAAHSAWMFILAQLVGAVLAVLAAGLLGAKKNS